MVSESRVRLKVVETVNEARMVKKVNIVASMQLDEVCGCNRRRSVYMRAELKFYKWWNFQQEKIGLND